MNYTYIWYELYIYILTVPHCLHHPYIGISYVLHKVMQIAATNYIEAYLIGHHLQEILSDYYYY